MKIHSQIFIILIVFYSCTKPKNIEYKNTNSINKTKFNKINIKLHKLIIESKVIDDTFDVRYDFQTINDVEYLKYYTQNESKNYDDINDLDLINSFLIKAKNFLDNTSLKDSNDSIYNLQKKVAIYEYIVQTSNLKEITDKSSSMFGVKEILEAEKSLMNIANFKIFIDNYSFYNLTRGEYLIEFNNLEQIYISIEAMKEYLSLIKTYPRLKNRLIYQKELLVKQNVILLNKLKSKLIAF